MAQLNLDFNALKKAAYTFNLKKIDTVNLSNFADFAGEGTTISASGSTLIVKTAGKTLKFTNILNPNALFFTGDYDNSFMNFYKDLFNSSWLPANRKTTKVTGSVFDDNIDVRDYNLSAKGLTINAGAGNDTITGTKNNDVILGGAGTNTVIFNPDLYENGFGVDTVKLTKGENLVIDISGCGYEDADALKNIISKEKKDLVITPDENSKIKIANFITANGVGDGGSVKVLLKQAEGGNPEISVNLNTDTIFSYNDNNFVKGKKNTATLTGTRFGEEVNITSGLKTYTKTLKMGKGENVININSDDFGTLTLAEEKVNASNVINFKNGLEGYDFTKSGNDLIISNETSKLTVSGYFLERTAKTKFADIQFQNNGAEIADILDGEVLNIAGKGKLIGTDGDDIFISSASNDTITGKTGENVITFSGKFGKDTVYLTEGENLILDMSGYEDLFGGHVKRIVSGNDLVIKAFDENNKLYGQVTLKNFAKTDVTGETGSVILRLPEEDINLNKDDFDVYATKSYTGSRFDEFIDAWDAKKAITIAGNKGDDYIISSQYRPTTFVFNEGDGNDRLSNTKAGDVIQINTAGEVTYTNTGSDLIIGYGNDDTILVEGYFASDDPVIDTIKIKNAQGKFDTFSLAEKTNIEEIKNKVLNVRINDREIILPSDTKYETINFVGYNGFTSIYTYGPEYGWEGKNDDDLYMPYGNDGDTIIFKDFFKNNGVHNTKHIVVGGKTYDLPRRYYSEANDNIIAPQTEDWLYLSGGDHKITFTENNNFHNYDYIYSEGSQYTDTLVLSDYSFRNGEIEIGRETGSNGSLVIYANDGIEYDKGGRRNNILYRHYFDENTPLVKIVDKNGTISMARTFATATMNWSTDAEKNNDHVLFVNNNSEDMATETTVISNTKANQIIVDAYTKEKATAKLNYTYKGGNDIIDTGDYYANDTYNIDSFSASSKLSVLDNGGYADTVNVNANSDDFYLLFNVDNYISEEPNPDEWAIGLVHKDALTAGTLKKYFTTYYDTDATVAGVLKFDGAGWGNADEESEEWDTSDYGGTIEFIRTNDVADRLDIAAWKKYVAGKVGNWLKDNNLKFSYGSPVKVMEAVEEGKLTLTDAQYQSLLDCYKVKYSELPQSGEFVSTTENDTFNLKEANNTITFDNATIGKDTINSNKEEYNASYKDRIIFTEETGYSVKNGTLKVGVNENDLVISADENNLATYTNFVSDETHNDVILTDASKDKYYLHVVKSGSGFKEGSNNIAFVYNDKVNNSIGTTTGRNFIYSYGENTYYENDDTEVTGGMWNCAYVGGEDTVVSYSDKASDKYEVYSFSKNSKLNVTDNGGAKDSLTIYYNEPKYDTRDALIDETRLVFDVNESGAIYDNFMLVYKDALSGETLHDTTQSDLVAGVLKYNATPTTANSFGIESFRYYKDDNKWRTELDINAWKNKIVENVQGWLTANDAYTSAYDAFEKCNDAGKLAELVQCYNVDYTTLNLG